LIYNTDDAWHRVSLRYIGRGIPATKNNGKTAFDSSSEGSSCLHDFSTSDNRDNRES